MTARIGWAKFWCPHCHEWRAMPVKRTMPPRADGSRVRYRRCKRCRLTTRTVERAECPRPEKVSTP